MQIKHGAYKTAIIYDDHVCLTMKESFGDEWLRHIANLGLINAVFNRSTGTWIVERVTIKFTHSADIKAIAKEYNNHNLDAVLELFKQYFPKWYDALKSFSDIYQNIHIDWKNVNFGYRENGEIVFFDIANPLYTEEFFKEYHA